MDIKPVMDTLGAILKIVGSLGVFLFGMKVMSDAIQKSAGEKLQGLLNLMTVNRFTAVLSGFAITAIIQSSSATTVILVSLVNAGLLNLTKAVGVIMGANIGTTATNWIVSLLGFKISIISFALPAVAFSIPLLFSKKERYKQIGEVLAGFAILFIGLDFLKGSVPDINSNLQVLEFVRRITSLGYLSLIISVILGTTLTIVVQSSSAAMAITTTMMFFGWIDFPFAAGLCLGENIGTTITAYLASMGMNLTARRAARAHMLFNIFGVIWMLLIFYPFVGLVDMIVPGSLADKASLPVHLSMFHTMFNLTNTFILVWFVPQFVKAVEFMVPAKGETAPREYRLAFLRTGFPDFAEVNLKLARTEIARLSNNVLEMLMLFRKTLDGTKKDLSKAQDIIRREHELSGRMTKEISKFLAECRSEIANDNQGYEINSYLIVVNELYSISKSADDLIDLFRRKEKKKLEFHKKGMQEIEEYTLEVLDFLRYNADFLNQNMTEHDYSLARKMEKAIDAKRDRLRKIATNKLEKGGDVEGELVYMEMIKHLEHIGDFNLTIAHYLDEL